MNINIPTQKEIREAAKNHYGFGTYWHGVKTDAFREGAKWMIARLKKKTNNEPNDQRSVATVDQSRDRTPVT